MITIINTLRKIKNNIRYYLKTIKEEKNFKTNYFSSFRMLLNGFTSDQYILYGFNKDNKPENYISEVERWRSREINGYYIKALDDKLLFPEIFDKYIDIPNNLFWIKQNKILDMNGNLLSDNELADILQRKHSIFMKPIIGGGGRGVYKISFKNGYFLNDDLIDFDRLLDYLKQEDNYVATEGIHEQHYYAKQIYPNSINTIRVLTIYDSINNTITIPEALHRFGTNKTQPVDNASLGGLFALIDVENGIISEAKSYNNKTYEVHPDTQMMIKGQKVPKWEELKEMCISVASKFSYIPYMAWDIVITENGFKVIEINASTDLTLVQMWDGKRNSELGKFFKTEKIIK